MSKTIFSLISFVAGMVVMSLVASGNHTSIFAQEPSAQSAPPATPPFIGVKIAGGPIPEVKPINVRMSYIGAMGAPSDVRVDGVECSHCVFDGAILRYGGGNFSLSDFSVSGPVRIELDGAARNTVLFLKFVEALRKPQSQIPPSQLSSNNPETQIINVSGTIKGSIDTALR
jgi:hypothetical protein